MALEVLQRAPAVTTGKPPLLFIHGAWHGAWCWEERFLPYFAERGYPSYALSLRAHGASPGALRWASLADYVEDVVRAVDGLPAPPVLIGHSMGGGVVQRYLEGRSAPGAVLLASMPPTGVIAVTLKIARTHPLLFLKANLTLSLKGLVGKPALAREWFFSKDMHADDVERYARKLQDESYRAFLDMLVLGLPRPNRVTAPLYVLGGAEDTVFPPAAVEATARAYRTKATILPDLAHDMMLDVRWRSAADAILDWLENGPVGAARTEGAPKPSA